MSEIKARASRRAFNAGSWERNGLVGRPVAGAGGVARGAVEPPVEGIADFGASAGGGVDAAGAGGRFAFAGVAGGPAGPAATAPLLAAGLETEGVAGPAGLGTAGLTGRGGPAGRGVLAAIDAAPVGAAGLGWPAKGFDGAGAGLAGWTFGAGGNGCGFEAAPAEAGTGGVSGRVEACAGTPRGADAGREAA